MAADLMNNHGIGSISSFVDSYRDNESLFVTYVQSINDERTILTERMSEDDQTEKKSKIVER